MEHLRAKMAAISNKSNKLPTNFSKLNLIDVLCPVCRSIFIEPVTLPCRHGLCLHCFEGTVEKNSLTCPMCRTRIGSWLRRATRSQKLVNDRLWEFIQKKFPEEVKAKLDGDDDGLEELLQQPAPLQISNPGEIRLEYQKQIQQYEDEVNRQRAAEMRASEDLIRQLQEEEEAQAMEERRTLELLAEADEKIAREINMQDTPTVNNYLKDRTLHLKKGRSSAPVKLGSFNKENKKIRSVSTTVTGPMDSFIGQKKLSPQKLPNHCISNLQQSSNKPKRSFGVRNELKIRSGSDLSTGSHDSINQELHHFKPIKVVPRTPPKKLPDGRVLEPKLIKTTPVNLNNWFDSLGKDVEQHGLNRLLPGKYQAERMREIQDVSKVLSSSESASCSAFRGTGMQFNKHPAGRSSQELGNIGAPHTNVQQSTLSDTCVSDDGTSYESERKRPKSGGNDFTLGLTMGCRPLPQCSKVDGQSSDSETDMEDEGPRDKCRPSMIHHKAIPENQCAIKLDTPVSSSNKGRFGNSSKNNFMTILSSEAGTSGVKFNNRVPIDRYLKSSGSFQTCSTITRHVREDKDSKQLDRNIHDVLEAEEQKRIEEMIKQEQADYELACKLQSDWNHEVLTVNRQKGSAQAYELRSQFCKKARQTTIEETLRYRR